MKIILWDIDGTLIRTDKAEQYAYNQAIAELFNNRPYSGQMCTNGMTDYHFASEVISEITGANPQEEEIVTLIRHYEELLPAHLAARQGYSIPPVLEILTVLNDNPNFVSLLLTGNSAAAARAKLDSHNLTKFFDFTTSAFGDSCHDRVGVAAQALALIQAKFSADAATEVFVLGDTPNDIRCGKSIGAQTIAVATGSYSLEELKTHSPWWAVERLPAPDEFIAKLSAD